MKTAEMMVLGNGGHRRMKGKKQFQAELFSMINIEELIPKSHFLRRLDGILDLAFIHDVTKNLYCESNGRPSIDPEVFFRICLVGYLYGISSDRQLCEELRYNLAYRWFCRFSLGDEIPDHSSMTRIRDRLGKAVFEEIFERVLDLCRKKKLIKERGEILYDASLIPANAALNSLVPKDASEEAIRNRGNVIRGKKFKNETHVSCSDPDARISGKTGVPKGLYYKVHNAIDAKSRVILDPHVTAGNVHDSTQLIDRIKYIEDTHDYHVDAVTADRAYGSGEMLEALEERAIDWNIGRFRKDSCENVRGLKFDGKQDRFQCPAGYWLKVYEAKDRNAKRYGFKDRPCTDCKKRNSCPLLPKLKREKYLIVNAHHEITLRAAKKEETERFVKKLRERMWKAEGLFAEAKVNHCLDRAKYRGLSKVQIQAYMTGITQNLKRLVEHVGSYLFDLMLEAFLRVKVRKIVAAA